jgi:hypothetical protein
MTPRVVAVGFSVALALLIWLFTGVERFAREHGETDYEGFVKQLPSFKVVYENKAKCGECDLRLWEDMSRDDRQKFSEYCAVRFGLDEPRLCYAIFSEWQRMMNEQSNHSSPPPTVTQKTQ